jgi:hypothetical protein
MWLALPQVYGAPAGLNVDLRCRWRERLGVSVVALGEPRGGAAT